MTAPLRPPTRPAGYVTDSPFAGIYDEWMEHVPALLWPQSVQVFAEMRTDPQVSAIVSAHTLPIRRASWGLSPTGCRPAVVARTADDMGLPVTGVDTPGAARTRGVSWPEHLRSALSHLTFGHAGFALHADVSSGEARLVGLYERLQSTISAIHVDTQGRLLGVSQDGRTDVKSPEIKADQLVWYVHEREGASWQGRSLIREAFSSWFVKREMIRVASTGHRRFSMGVPTVEWETGVMPTPAQMSEARAAASAARVGETAGLALPPGARLVLKGLEGSSPDTLAFIKWLDLQISGSVLARWMDLGSTETGSRALATAFVDLFLLSIQAVADFTADTATRQIAARCVAWNEGDQEPVPAVQVGDVGAKNEVTAESLKLLMDSGALSADPALEAHIRRQYKLPERDGMAKPAPSVQGDTVSAANRRPRPQAAAKRPTPRRRRTQAAGQTALPMNASAGDEGDEADAHQAAWESARDELLSAWPETAAPMVDDLVTQVEDGISAGDIAALGALAVSVAVVAGVTEALTASMLSLAGTSAGQVVEFAARQGVTIGVPDDPGAGQVGQVAEVTAALIASGYAAGAARKALLLAGPDADPVEVAAAVRAHLDEFGTSTAGLVGDNVGGALSAAQNAGRAAVFEAADPQPKSYRAVESLDKNTCVNCSDAAGREYPTLADALMDYAAVGLKSCLGGLRCRGFIHAVWT
jgi:hypothetical protein